MIAAFDAVEEWRPVAECAGYEVSSWGSARGPRGRLKPGYVRGYAVVSTSIAGKVTTRRIHRMVAEAFLGAPPFADAIVAHNDGDSKNNKVSNLRWASARENQADRNRHDRRCRGSAVYGAKLTEADIPIIRNRIDRGERYPSIANDFGVSVSTISLISRQRIWRGAGGSAWSLRHDGRSRSRSTGTAG